MNGPQDGIYVSKRVVFILIFVSLFVNVFFLLMGILIGKDDLKWQQAETSTPPEMAGPATEEQPTDPIDSELSVFQEEAEDRRRDPIDPSYLEEGGSPATGTANREPTPGSSPTPPPANPEPTDPAPRATPRPTPTNVPPTVTPTATVYWIQVTASRDAAGARAELRKVEAKAFRGVVIQEDGFYKVRVGPYAARPSANRDLQRLKRELGMDGWIVKKP